MKMNHVTINCSDLDKSVAFYKDIVGLDVAFEINAGPHKIVFLSNGEGETNVELIHAPEDPYSGKGLSMGFGCGDVDAYHEELAAKGCDPTPIISPNPDTKFFFVSDPDGVKIQFI